MSASIQWASILILLFTTMPSDVAGYSLATFSGSDQDEASPYYSACVKMSPDASQHGAQPMDTASDFPYVLEVAETKWKPGETLSLTIKSTDGSSKFKGLMLQARKETGMANFNGAFSTPSGTKGNCNGRALTHASGAEKTELQITWTAPDDGSTESVVFLYTLVKEKAVYWVNKTSAAISLDATTAPPPPNGVMPLAVSCTLLIFVQMMIVLQRNC